MGIAVADKILGIAVPGQDVGASAVHRGLRGDQDKNGIFLPRAIPEKCLEAVPDGGCRGYLIGQHQHLIGRNTAAAEAAEVIAESFRIGIGILEPEVLRELLVFRDADQERVGFGVGRDLGGFEGGLGGQRFLQFEDPSANPNRILPLRRDLAICGEGVGVEMFAIENGGLFDQRREVSFGSARRALSKGASSVHCTAGDREANGITSPSGFAKPRVMLTP